MRLRAGALRHKIVIQRQVLSVDEFGSAVVTWTNIKETRASINPSTGEEWFINNELTNQVDHVINLRYTDLSSADRIIYDNRVFNLVRVLNDQEKRVSFIVLAKERL